MAKIIIPLSDTKIDSAKNKDKPYPLSDGGGLYLEVRPLPSKKKVWRYKYPHSITGKDVKLTLDSYPALSLVAARAKRREFESMRANGLDPREQIELTQAKKENAHSLEKVARAWHAETTAKGQWGADTSQKTMRKLENHLFPIIGHMSIEEVEPQHIAKALTAIDNKGVNRVARDLKANLVRIFSYAIQNGYVRHNLAREMDGLIITKKKKHYPQLKHDRLPELLQRIDSYTRGAPITRLCTLLSLHVFSRSSEVRFARWSEIDFDKQQWIIPASREAVEGVRYSERGAKMKEEHLVPLSAQAVAVLREIQQYSGNYENVFPGRDDPKKFISENTINTALQRMGYDTETDVCGHGFRGMACSALVQSTLFSEDAVERQMSHMERNEVRGAYTHMAEFLEERRSMMNWWSNYLDQNRQQHITPHDYGKIIKEQNGDNNLISFPKMAG
jgi:integrase